MVLIGSKEGTLQLHPFLGSSCFPAPQHSATVRTQLQKGGELQAGPKRKVTS